MVMFLEVIPGFYMMAVATIYSESSQRWRIIIQQNSWHISFKLHLLTHRSQTNWSDDQNSRGGNKFGVHGTKKCEACRRRKARVDITLLDGVDRSANFGTQVHHVHYVYNKANPADRNNTQLKLNIHGLTTQKRNNYTKTWRRSLMRDYEEGRLWTRFAR